MRLEPCYDTFQLWLGQFFGGFRRRHPFAAPLLFFGPFAVHVGNAQRVNHGDDRCISDLLRFVIAIDPQAEVNRIPAHACFFKGFGGGGIRWCLLVHRPTFGNDPALAGAAGDQANLNLVVFHAPAQCCELRAHIRLTAGRQFQGKLFCDSFRHVLRRKTHYIGPMADDMQASDPQATPPPRFIGSEIYRYSSYGAWHPLRVPRVSTVMDLARALGWLPKARFINSPRAKPSALMGFHTPKYLAALQAAEAAQAVSEDVRLRHNLGTPSNPVFKEMFRRPATSAGASLLAGELLKNGGVIYTPAGGTHHGLPDRANGFCYLNDPVLAIQSLRRNGAQRIVYVDIDAHHPDGVEHAFGDDPDTLLISVHEQNRWPRTGQITDAGVGQVYNLPVPAGLNDTEMALIRDEVILPLTTAFRPDAIVLQCGADAVTEDPQSRLTLSNNAHWAIVAALMPIAPRYLVLGGGGYNPWSVGRLWTGVWATLNGYEIPDRLPPAAQGVLGALTWAGPLRQHHPEPHWIDTLRDAPRSGPISDEVRSRVGQLAARSAVWT